jgi:hypothetical protein
MEGNIQAKYTYAIHGATGELLDMAKIICRPAWNACIK